MIKRIILFIAWITSLVLISLVGGKISYGIFITLTLIPLLSLVYLFIVNLTFRIYQELGTRTVVAGERTDYLFKIRNSSVFAYSGIKVELYSNFFSVDELPNNIEYELLPEEEICFKTQLSCKYRGQYEVGVKRVIIHDFFRLFTWKHNSMSTLNAIVQPKYFIPESLKCLDNISSLKASSEKSGADYPDAVVRDYLRGDSIRHIHWKSTAKTGSLKVRNFYSVNNEGIRLYLNTKRISNDIMVFLPAEDKILSVMLSIVAFFAYRNTAVNICFDEFNSHTDMEIATPKQFNDLYGRISELAFSSSMDEFESVNHFHNEYLDSKEDIVFIISQELGANLLAQAEAISMSGSYVIIYTLDNEKISSSNERLQIINVELEDELEVLLQ